MEAGSDLEDVLVRIAITKKRKIMLRAKRLFVGAISVLTSC